ncbi:MAG: hypothetical protein ABIP85_19725 [Chthoniobacteraceae bacterium]
MSHRQFNASLRFGALWLAFSSVLVLAADSNIPDTFLSAPGRLREVLKTPVSGTFRATPAPEVIASLCRQLPANNVYKRDIAKPAAPTFTGTFKDTPLRIALYQVTQATRITIELVDRGDGSKLISAHE